MTESPSTRTMRDRRRGRRVLTVRNVIVATAVAIAIFVTVSIASEFRKPTPGEYGRLYETRTVRAVDASPAPTVITEAPIGDAVAADPLLIETQRKERMLEGEVVPLDARAVAAAADGKFMKEFTPERPLARSAPQGEGSRFVITGGAGGVYTAVTDDE